MKGRPEVLFNFTPIQKEWFQRLDGGKTKLNWFLLEVALEYYDRIRDSAELAPYREQYSEDQIAQFCAYYARRMKKSLLDCIRGRRKRAMACQEYIDDFYPHHGDKLNGLLNDVAKEAWDSMVGGCRLCPQQCLADYMGRATLFDEYMGQGE